MSTPITFTGACDDWQLIHISKDGDITFSDASDYLGLGNFDVARKLHEAFGDKVSLALCGPVGEYLGLLAGIDLEPGESFGQRGYAALQRLYAAGLLVRVTADSVILAPALIAEREHVDHICDTLREVLSTL